jgi:hypothetical protein
MTASAVPAQRDLCPQLQVQILGSILPPDVGFAFLLEHLGLGERSVSSLFVRSGSGSHRLCHCEPCF